jgi:predicted nucleic acid-binding protein
MHDNIVLDSSIIAAIFFPEKISGKSLTIAEIHDCITVDLAYAEVANVAWKRSCHTGQDATTVKNMLDECTAFISETCQVLPAQDLVPAAYDLACHHRITIYDALFLAAAIHSASPLVTADKKLHLAASGIVKTELVY